ncbi:Clp protease N-terminal domain-containing protein [Protaetiibacter larvae]|uniref:Uncharacterized protein n=1 Tax=Protaetiibacter larvae TaxID=2592654 RepID=A0A5C1Y6X9_9MICO|nr:Clp protease N-terminal domain-containing protein [Protaetiibacter larvae]QEO09556.1 hypothetical protein FLP23_05755 [Protaetiibacter larvae]
MSDATRSAHHGDPRHELGGDPIVRADFGALFGVASLEATNRGAPNVEAEHLLLAFLFDRRGKATTLLGPLGLNYEAFTDALAKEREHTLAAVGVRLPEPARLTAAPRVRGGRPRFGSSAKDAWERASRNARASRGGRPRTMDLELVRGILSAELGTVPRALVRGGFDRHELLAALDAALTSPRKDNTQ